MGTTSYRSGRSAGACRSHNDEDGAHWCCRSMRGERISSPKTLPSIRAIVDACEAPVDAELMGALPNLGAIIHYLDGYDTVDIDAARLLGIGLSNTADALTGSVADVAVGLVLMTTRRLAPVPRSVTRAPAAGRPTGHTR